MNIDSKVVTLFNEYFARIKENIVTCGKTSMSVKLSDSSFAFVMNAGGGKISENKVQTVIIEQAQENRDIERHRIIYCAIKDANAVIHTHTPYAAAIGKTGKTIPALLDDTAQIIGIDTRCCADDTANISKILKKRKGCIIIGNGTITHGRTLDEAYTGCLVLEKAAKCFINANLLGNYKKIPYIEAVLMHFIYQKKYSKANQNMLKNKQVTDNTIEIEQGVIDSGEAALRRQVVDAGKRLLNSNLVQGTWGNISIRLDDTHMLITPSGLDYLTIKPEDIVKVNFNTMEYEGKLKPSGEKDIHAMLLKSRKDINVVMHCHPNEGSAFAVALLSMPVVSAEMQSCVKGDAKVSKYALPSTKSLAHATVKAIEGRNACFMANHGMLSVGVSIDEAFECCQVMEDSADKYIDAKAAEYDPSGNTAEEKRIDAFYKMVSLKMK
ncbi:MAG: hypothetical protein EOM87_00470 [Clostridia bacterium]|nr:hypothetical protein [Clostridia bacterium]